MQVAVICALEIAFSGLKDLAFLIHEFFCKPASGSKAVFDYTHGGCRLHTRQFREHFLSGQISHALHFGGQVITLGQRKAQEVDSGDDCCSVKALSVVCLGRMHEKSLCFQNNLSLHCKD
ncbi:hypothetical protein SUGI_0331370 [Cryptomeria japonica]|nr:hypothetical protein SUGI_0331370 [Cryptomeria japonica]